MAAPDAAHASARPSLENLCRVHLPLALSRRAETARASCSSLLARPHTVGCVECECQHDRMSASTCRACAESTSPPFLLAKGGDGLPSWNGSSQPLSPQRERRLTGSCKRLVRRGRRHSLVKHVRLGHNGGLAEPLPRTEGRVPRQPRALPTVVGQLLHRLFQEDVAGEDGARYARHLLCLP
jgi:hypothetical protein